MPVFTKAHAEDSARKLKSKPKDKTLPTLVVREVVAGPHRIQQIWCANRLVNQFGIKHGSNRNASHGWIARDLNLSPRKAFEFAACTRTIDEMIQHFLAQVSLKAGPNVPADLITDYARLWLRRSFKTDCLSLVRAMDTIGAQSKRICKKPLPCSNQGSMC
jgi:hypothetical protein